MAFTTAISVVTGQTYSAANYNTYVKDNLNALWVYTTAGDIVYATGATTLARLGLTVGGLLYGGASAPAWLAKPSVDSLLQNTSAGVPSWAPIKGVGGAVHTTGHVEYYPASSQTTTSTTFVDITGMSVTLTLTKTCTIIALAFGLGGTNIGSAQPCFALSIDGTTDPGGIVSSSAGNMPFVTAYRRTGITAGSRAVKLRFKTSDAADYASYTNGRIVALAIVE